MILKKSKEKIDGWEQDPATAATTSASHFASVWIVYKCRESRGLSKDSRICGALKAHWISRRGRDVRFANLSVD